MSETTSSQSPEENSKADSAEQESTALSISMDQTLPHGNSLLFCPAHWNALLEAAPVSLVVRETRERAVVPEDEADCDVEGEVAEREGEKVPRLVFAEDDEVRIPLGEEGPVADQ